MTDETFACGARMGSLALGATFPIFQYLFMPATWGVVPHGAEIGYVFQAEWLKGKDDRDLAAQMLAMWVAFAATGKPTSTSVEDIDAVTWPRFDPAKDGPYLQLNVASAGGLKTATRFRAHACESFWDVFIERKLKGPAQ